MYKSDFVKGKYVIDLKEVEKSFTLNEKVWGKVCADAWSYSVGKVPVLLIKFASGARMVCLDETDFDWESDD